MKQLEIEMNTLQIDKFVAIPLGQMFGCGAVAFLVFGNFLHVCTDDPMLKIGIYSEIKTAAINAATQSRITGSTQLRSAVERRFTSSS